MDELQQKIVDYVESNGKTCQHKKAAADNHAFDNVDFYVCKVCGYTHEGPCDSCPVCGAKAAAFFKVDDACCLNK